MGTAGGGGSGPSLTAHMLAKEERSTRTLRLGTGELVHSNLDTIVGLERDGGHPRQVESGSRSRQATQQRAPHHTNTRVLRKPN